MARIRSVKPEFWVDRSFVRKVPNRDARMLYMALWNLADEHGRLMADVSYLKGHIFPYAEDSDLTPDVIDKMLDDLASVGKVVRYEVDGDPYLFLPTLHRHQRLESKVPSRHPAPPGDGGAPDPGSGGRAPQSGGGEVATVTQLRLPPEGQADEFAPYADESAWNPGQSAPDANASALLYGSGSMEPGAGSMETPQAPGALFGLADPAVPDAAADKPQPNDDATSKPKRSRAKKTDASASTSRGTRIPDDFAITERMRKWGEANAPDINGLRATEEFIDYWRGVPGAKGLKLDWEATWRNRMRELQDRAAERLNRSAPRPAIPPQRQSATAQRTQTGMDLIQQFAAEEGVDLATVIPMTHRRGISA